MAKRRDAGRSLARRGPTRDPLPYILVVCEGSTTEPQYLNAFRMEHANRLVRVEINAESGVPKTLVVRAIELRDDALARAHAARDDSLTFDEVWCVFDVDEHPKLGDALQQARDNGILAAVSNPCFELWLLLHFEDQTAYLDRKLAIRKLRKHIVGYDKRVNYAPLRDLYNVACDRARRLDARHAALDAPGTNPSTGVHALTERIRLLRGRLRPTV